MKAFRKVDSQDINRYQNIFKQLFCKWLIIGVSLMWFAACNYLNANIVRQKIVNSYMASIKDVRVYDGKMGYQSGNMRYSSARTPFSKEPFFSVLVIFIYGSFVLCKIHLLIICVFYKIHVPLYIIGL